MVQPARAGLDASTANSAGIRAPQENSERSDNRVAECSLSASWDCLLIGQATQRSRPLSRGVSRETIKQVDKPSVCTNLAPPKKKMTCSHSLAESGARVIFVVHCKLTATCPLRSFHPTSSNSFLSLRTLGAESAPKLISKT